MSCKRTGNTYAEQQKQESPTICANHLFGKIKIKNTIRVILCRVSTFQADFGLIQC